MTKTESNGSAAKLHLYKFPQTIIEDKFNDKYSQFPYIPLKTRRAVAAPAHQRWKLENFSAEVCCGWNDSGLLLSFKIRDRQVHNNAAPELLWSEDCLEVFLDLRKEQTAEYIGNSMHLFVAPPSDGMDGRFYILDRRAHSKEFTVKSFIIPGGWGGNIFIPWIEFPGFEAVPGSELGMGIQICDDYGRPGNNPFFVAQYLRFGNERMPNDARVLPRWLLSEKFEPSPENDLANVIAVDVQNLVFDSQINANIIIAEQLKKDVAFLEWECIIAERKITGNTSLDKLCFELPHGVYGNGLIKLKVYDAQKRILGVLQLSFERFNGEGLRELQKTVISLIKKADLPTLTKFAPEKVAGYFGLLNNYEQLKRMVFLEKTSDMNLLVAEMNLRMQLLQNQPLKTEDKLLEFLQISAAQDAQVSVEYPRYHPDNKRKDDVLIKFYCGAVILAKVQITLNKKCTVTQRKWIPAVYSRQMMPTEKKDHLLFIFTMGANHHKIYLTDAKSLYGIQGADAAVIAANAPVEHVQAVQEYAAKHNLPIVKEENLTKGMRVIYAGRPDKSSTIGKLFAKAYNLVWVTAGRKDMIVEFSDGLVAQIRCMSPVGCELIADTLVARRAFSRKESTLLVNAVAAELAERSVKPCDIPNGYALMAADVHCHSIYSDGVLTPLGLVAAALYSQMDFLLISDHETASGVLDLLQKFEKYNVKFPLIAGEENSLPDGHFNSYPITESIPFNLSFDELIKAAHAQGALVQYNHPATFSNRRDWQLHGIAGTGLEAWEHEIPPCAKKWREIPAQIGSSDNHNSAFPSERTITYAENMNGKAFQEAVRQKRTGMLDAVSEDFIYGPEALKGMLLKALQNPERYLLAPYHQHLQKFLHNADVAGLFNDLPGATPEELGLQ